jgi:hypothetical protein
MWPVPHLAPRQNRIVVPALVRLGAQPQERYGALLDMIFAALTRAHPDLDREEFEDWPLPACELMDALPVIARQTGLMREARNAAKAELPDWDAIIAQCVNFLPGTTWDYWEDALTVPRLDALREEWRRHPPLALLAASYLGYRPRPRAEESLEDLLRLFPHGKLRLN